ncbi:MAG: hypothetical protein EUB_02819 [Eubacterium sp.]|uniref:hypothetical protein n=1 Tax=Eubacterium TaxID=1730 RepID=UPI0008808199|nr:hypothetical protein [Eubacterium maltosivorans]WPK78753.1 hypothetical protein EUMA32_01440 [Eubacterium maltosivorans]SDO39222.1 hypothetical protein SAMN04515624_10218 [Eubacterium maltosivorans]
MKKKKNNSLMEEMEAALGKSLQSEIHKDTYNTYRKRCSAFLTWVQARYGCQSLAEARRYADQWLKNRLRLSKPTRLVDASALAKLYHSETYHDFYLFDEEKAEGYLEHLKIFCRATGLRRQELALLKKGCLIIICDQSFIYMSMNGNLRMVPIIENSTAIIKYITTRNTPHIWPDLPKSVDYEAYRKYYASKLYQRLMRCLGEIERGEKYLCQSTHRLYDRRAILKLSQILDIDDLDLLIENYLI